MGVDGIKDIWHAARLRGCGYNRAKTLVEYAEKSVGLTDGITASREAVIWYAEEILRLDMKLEQVEAQRQATVVVAVDIDGGVGPECLLPRLATTRHSWQ